MSQTDSQRLLQTAEILQGEVSFDFFPKGQPIRPQTDAELLLAIELLFGYRFPTKSVCPGHTAPGTAICDAYFARSPFAVWLASRGFGGKSTALGALTLMELIAGMDIITLGGSAQQSARVLEVMNKGWDHRALYEVQGKTVELAAPLWALKKRPNTEQTQTIWNNRARALAASETSVRGEHPQRLRLDEVDAMDMRTYNSAQGMPLDSADFQHQTVASSTRQNSGGTMDQVMEWAEEQGYPVAIWCYRENMISNGGFITEEQLERKRKSVPAKMFLIEFENQEPASEGKLFEKAVLDEFFNKDLGQVDDQIGEELYFEEYEEEGEYVVAADWARDNDFTVISVWRYDTSPARLVAWNRTHKEPFPAMVEMFNQMADKYPGSTIHDATGIGKVIEDMIEAPGTVHFNIGGSTRTKLISNYVTAVEQGQLQAPVIKSMLKEHRQVTTKVYKGGEHLPDTVCSAALANAVITKTTGQIKKVKRPGKLIRVSRW